MGAVPLGLEWRSSTAYILTTITLAMFVDLFLYGLIVPIVPFILTDRLHLPPSQIQSYTSLLLASFAGASFLGSLPAGILADRLSSRQLPFLTGLAALMGATLLLWLGETIEILILARILQGISAAVCWTIGTALITDTVGSAKLGVTIGSMFSFISVGELISPVLGGIMYEKAGSSAVFGMGFALVGLDFVMRLLVIEKKVAKRYGLKELSTLTTDGLNEASALLHPAKPTSEDLSRYEIPSDISRFYTYIPLSYPLLNNPRLPAALLLCFTQALLLGTFDATIPLESATLYNFTSLRAGLLFIPLVAPYLLLGPFCGHLVDVYGCKLPATFGLFYEIVPLCLLSLPQPAFEGTKGFVPSIILFSIILAAMAPGMSLINAPSIVEASKVVESYHLANPTFFNKEGPYAQLYAMNSMIFSLGLTVGPLAAGALRESVGFGGMGFVVAGICAVVGTVCFCFLGTPVWEMRWKFWKRNDDGEFEGR